MFELFLECFELAVAEHRCALVVGFEGLEKEALQSDEPFVTRSEGGGRVVIWRSRRGLCCRWCGCGGRAEEGKTRGPARLRSRREERGGIETTT